MSDDELRAMDAEIHRKVFRLFCERTTVTGPSGSLDWVTYSEHGAAFVPQYSAKIEAAWRVAEKLREHWGCFHLVAGLRWHCSSTGSNIVQPEGSGGTPMLAICRAALKAFA